MKKFVLLASVFTFLFSPMAMAETKVEEGKPAKTAEAPPPGIPEIVTTATGKPKEAEKPAKPQEAERPAALRKLLLDSLDRLRFELATQSVTLDLQGDFIIDDKQTHLTVSTPAIKVLYANGDTLDVGIIHLNIAQVEGAKSWKVTMALPSTLKQKSLKGEMKARLDIGKQKFGGVWNSDSKVFESVKAEYNDVQVSFLEQKSVLRIGRVGIDKFSSEPTGHVSKPREIVGLGFSAMAFLFAVVPEVGTKGSYLLTVDNAFLRETGHETGFSGTVEIGARRTLDISATFTNPAGTESAIVTLAADPIMDFMADTFRRARQVLRAVNTAGLKTATIKYLDGKNIYINDKLVESYLDGSVTAPAVPVAPPMAPAELKPVGTPKAPEAPKAQQ